VIIDAHCGCAALTPFDVPDLEAELLAASGDEPGVRVPTSLSRMLR
jgi:hypothetical protein